MSEASLDKVLVAKGPAAAEKLALAADARSGTSAWEVRPEGLVGPDYRHVLVYGSRTFKMPKRGGVFYDPIKGEVAIVSPFKDGVWVEVGPMDVQDSLACRGCSKWEKSLARLVQYVARAPDEDVQYVSTWAVRKVAQAVQVALEKDGAPSGLQRSLAKTDPKAVWVVLGTHWFSQPYGLGQAPSALGGLV